MTILRGKFFMAACLLAASGLFSITNEAKAQGVSEAQGQPAAPNYSVGVTNLAIRPEAGAIFYNGNQKFAGGAMVDFNFLSTSWLKLGPSVGALYSSMSGTDFFSGVSTDNSQYIFQLPANLKAMISPIPKDNRLAIGAHGGANIIRTSGGAVATSGVFGGPSTTNITANPSGSWDVHPNVGLDLEYSLGTNFGISLRPDVTLMSAFNMTTLTLGLALQL